MSTERSKTETNQSDIEWNAENEVNLFYAMKAHKPIGVSKHFHMIAILDYFMNTTSKEISSQVIWDHLNELYDMETLHENEELPFPNEETEFTLEGNPDFDELLAKKTKSKKPERKAETPNPAKQVTKQVKQLNK